MWELGRGEGVALAGIVLTIVGINKLVVHDTGNSWPGLLMVSVFTGLIAVHAWRWVRRRLDRTGAHDRSH